MDINLIYMVLGVVATTLVGYWGMKYSSLNKTVTNLLFFENGCISLFKNVVKDLEDLEITYKGNRIDENLLIYKGTFFNSGNTDIDKSIIHKPLKVILPENYEWKKVKIIDKSIDVNIEYHTTIDELILSWDILKENEYFTFDSVIEYKPQVSNDKTEDPVNKDITKLLSRNIAFSQRITNLKSVNKEKLPSKPTGIFELIFFGLYLLAIFGAGLYFSVGQFVFPDYEVAHEIKIDSTYFYTPIKVKGKNEITISNGPGKKFDQIINKDNEIGLTGKIKTVKAGLSYYILIPGGLFAIVALIMFFSIVNSHIRKKSLYKKVKKIADKYDEVDFPEERISGLIFPFDL